MLRRLFGRLGEGTGRFASPPDAVFNAQTTQPEATSRPEQQRSEHDKSNVFHVRNALPSWPEFKQQPQEGKNSGFDFARDPLNSDKPMTTFDEVYQKNVAEKAQVNQRQQQLLQQQYNLTPKLDPQFKMTRGKPICVGPTARLAQGMSWEKLAQMTPPQIKQSGVFPYPSLPQGMVQRLIPHSD